MKDKKNIAIIGAGWYGCHLALALKKNGHDVTLYEKNNTIFSEISGNFGIRLHAGPHYPRSLKTRESCRRGAQRFIEEYPDLVIKHEHAIYALGTTDAEGKASKTDKDMFHDVCAESSAKQIQPKEYGYENLISAYNIDEPSIALGERVRTLISS